MKCAHMKHIQIALIDLNFDLDSYIQEGLLRSSLWRKRVPFIRFFIHNTLRYDMKYAHMKHIQQQQRLYLRTTNVYWHATVLVAMRKLVYHNHGESIVV